MYVHTQICAQFHSSLVTKAGNNMSIDSECTSIQTVVHPAKGIVPRIKEELTTDTLKTWINLRIIIVNERSITTYYMIPPT